MQKNIRNIICIAGLITITQSACKKKDNTPQSEPPPANGNVMMHLHTNTDTSEVDTYNKVYIMTGGRKISVSTAQLYISGIQLIKSDGSTFDIQGLNILKLMQTEPYSLGSVPAGNYKSIRFNVGLPPATNSSVPSVSDSTLNRGNMWFGASAQPLGYIFLNFQGKIDTSSKANGTIAQMQAFTYKIGTNGRLKSITMPDQNYTVVSNQTQFLHIKMDYSRLLTGLTLNNSSNLLVGTSGDNAGALADKVAGNIPLIFSYE